MTGRRQPGFSAAVLALALAGCVAHAPLAPSGEQPAPGEPGVDVVQQRRDELAVAAADAAADPAQMRAPVELVEPIDSTTFVLDDAEQRVVGRVQIVLARADDTLSDMARTYGLGYDDLVNANPGVDPWLPGEGTPVVLPTQFVLPEGPREGIVLNIAAKRLYHFPEAAPGEPRRVITHPIGIGRVGWATPTGSASVIAKAENPTWYVPLSVRKEHREMGDPLPAVVPPGPDNPLGHRVLKLDIEGYLIHGTNQPYGVGMRVSHGCVRLYPENIETLYAATALGTPVTIVNEPVLGAWQDGRYYLQAHPVLEDDERSADELLTAELERAAAAAKYFERDEVQPLAADVVELARGYPRVIAGAGETAANAEPPLAVENIVVVDNPVTEEELAELMSAAEESDSVNLD
ncbi:MAG: L,D-transpeptidase family protein [Pseudomonadota bacterium]